MPEAPPPALPRPGASHWQVLRHIVQQLAHQHAGQRRLEALVVAEADELVQVRESLQVQRERLASLEAQIAATTAAVEQLSTSLVIAFSEKPRRPWWRRWWSWI